MNATSLAGRRILVTGASADSAIGLAICTQLAELGAELILVGRRAEQLEQTRQLITAPERHCVAPMDLGQLDGIAAQIKALAQAGGVLHGIVHSASFQGYSALSRISAEQFDQYFHVNVAAPLMLAKGLRQKGVSAPAASMVFIGSVAGLRGQKARSLYAASKAALVSLTQSLALELADRSIRVNCIAPAVVSGPKADEQMKLLAAPQREALLAAHPLGLGMPMDVAQATAFLLSDASRWISGATLPVDGGFLAG
jgi:NAD(P)-dependent dehydrogenase (short-subunit alcohol dehydrogenase family)